MKEQSDTLVKLIHDAAGQVGPLDGIDGEAMARRAIRHEHTRRGVIGAAVAIVLVTLGTVGTAWFVERPLLPAVLPWMHDEVRSDGLIFELPDDYEEFSPTGDPMWGLDPVIPGEYDMESPSAESWVAVEPVDGVPLVGRQVGNPVVDTEVPGAVAAKYSWYTADGAGEPMADDLTADDGDFVGELDVELADGTVVRVTMKLHDDAAPQATFERLVDTVRIDEEYEAPEAMPMIPQEDLPILEAGDVPASWRQSEFHGLEYAVPGDWGIGLSPENVGDTQILKRPDGKVELRMELTDHLMYLDNAQMAAEYAEVGEDLENYYRFDLADADVSQVLIDRGDDGGQYQAYIEVRRAGGRGYQVNLFGDRGATDDDDLAAVLGSLGFTAASKDGATAYDDLDPADPLLQGTPSDWEPVTFEGLDMRLPQELKSDEGTWGIWNSDSPDSWEDLSIALWDLEAYEQPFDLDESGYRYEPPGTERGVVTVGTDPETGEGFLGRATFWLTADGRKSFEVRYEGSGATEERWWQILESLDAAELDVS